LVALGRFAAYDAAVEMPETIGRYRVLKKLGEGGMGQVYLAQDTQLARRVAIKVLPTEASQTEARLQRFIQEAYAVSALNHPAIIVIHEIGADHGIQFMATEYVEGLTLRDLMQK
jgi:serine/threonine-protein kinase